MKELFPFNNTKEAYNFFTTFLRNNYNIQKIKGKVRKDFLEIEFKYNSLEPNFEVENFNKECFDQLELTFSPFDKYGDSTSYSLSGRKINVSNLKNLLKLCKLHDIPICKKCGKHPIKYYEECLSKTTYSADLTGNPYIYKYKNINSHYSDAPLPLKVNAVCSCKNKWTLKGIITAHQIVDASTLNNEFYSLGDRHQTKVYTQKEMDDILRKPTEYAKIENKKHFGHTTVLTKKEINQLLRAINVGEKDAK